MYKEDNNLIMAHNAFQAYRNMFKPTHIINEADDDLDLDIDVKEEPAGEKKPEKKQEEKKPVVEKTEVSNDDADMKFSIDLATEFSNTINEFTNICAKMVEKRIINKDMSDRFYDLYSKIKNLADAASKTK